MNSSRRSRRSGGASPGRRFAFLAVLVAAFLLVPVAQAFAETPHLKVNISGTGSGEVEGLEQEEFGLGPGTPTIECEYNGTSQTGVCENVPDSLFGEGELFAEQLIAIPAPGSEFAG
jgi:hypothetical protein